MADPRKKNTIIKELNKSKGLLFLAFPSLVFIIIFNYVPLYGLILPFINYKYDLGFFKSPWVGFTNFKFLFNSDALFVVTRNTVLYNLAFIVLGTFVSVALALMLFELSKKAVKVYQTVMFFPYFISWVVVSYVFLAMLDVEYGVFNTILKLFGKEPVMWYSEPKYWPFIIVIAAIWKSMGYGCIIYYAGLMGIDPEYYEAADLDGASKLQRIIHISIPMLTPLITILTILGIGRIFYSDFGLFYNVTLNSTLIYRTTDVIDTFVFRSLRQLGDIGMSSAAGLYQSIVGFILVFFTNYVVKKINSENSLF